MTDEELRDLYIEHIWTKAKECYRDELNQCEDIIIAGIKTILEVDRRERVDGDDWLGEDQ